MADSMTGMIIAGVVVIFALITLSQGVRIVPQGEEWIVERLGRYSSILKPGLSVIIPFVDSVAYRFPTKDIILDVQQQEIITKDNAVILANALAFAKVIDPQKAAYGVHDYQFAVSSLVMTSLRAIVGKMDLNEALSSRDEIKSNLRAAMQEQTADWGITIRSVEIQDIKPSELMQHAMEGVAAAERERKADVTRAEGKKQAAILEAEARQLSAAEDAKATVSLAKASAEAIGLVKDAIGSDVTSSTYLLGERYITALESMSTSPNTKLVLLPADIRDAVRGLLGAAKS